MSALEQLFIFFSLLLHCHIELCLALWLWYNLIPSLSRGAGSRPGPLQRGKSQGPGSWVHHAVSQLHSWQCSPQCQDHHCCLPSSQGEFLSLILSGILSIKSFLFFGGGGGNQICIQEENCSKTFCSNLLSIVNMFLYVAHTNVYDMHFNNMEGTMLINFGHDLCLCLLGVHICL